MNLYQKGTRQLDRRYPKCEGVVKFGFDICKEDKGTAIVPAIKSIVELSTTCLIIDTMIDSKSHKNAPWPSTILIDWTASLAGR